MTEFTCTAAALAKILRDAKSVVKPRQTMLILNNVMIDARDGIVTVTATDLDIEITRTLPAEIETAGAFTVEAARFTDVIGSFPDGAQVKLVADGGFVKLTCARSRFSFPTLDANDFPPMPFTDPVASFDGSARLLQGLAAVRHAVSTNETRYHLCGAFIGNRDGLEIAATDGDQQLAICRPDIQADIGDMILGVGAIDAIVKRDGEFKVELVANAEGMNTRIRFAWPDATITAKLIDGTFPDYRKVIPDDPRDVIVDGDDVAHALGRIAMLSDDKARSVRLDFEKGKLTITSRTALVEDVLARAGGGGVEEMPCDYSGELARMTFRAAILRDAIASIDADKVTFGLSAPVLNTGLGPVKVTSAARPDMTLVVMTMVA